MQVWRGALVVVAATGILQFWPGLYLGYGLDFWLGMLAFRVVCYLDWLLDLEFASRIILSVKVKVLGGGFGLWLDDNIAILSMLNEHNYYF